jgi:hypothetical protein
MRLPSVEDAEFGVGPAVSARLHTFGERPDGLLAADTPHRFTGHVAAADMYGDGMPTAQGLLK